METSSLGRSNRNKLMLSSGLILIVTALHYSTSTEYHYLHELFEHLYYIPVLLVAFWYGPKLGTLAAAITSLLYLVHIRSDWSGFPTYNFDQYMHIFLYHLFALIIGFLATTSRRRLAALERLSQELSTAYEDLELKSEQLRRADRLAALGHLSAGIAHEVRNPLGSIKGSIEILDETLSDTHPMREFIGIIKEETARLNSLVTDFLNFARPPLPKVKATSINELIESTLLLVRGQAESSNIEIRWVKDHSEPDARIDRNQLRQVLLNMLLNSVQAMPEGGILGISSQTQRDGRVILIEISDTGGGLEEEDIDRIFDPFWTTKPYGTGLGLSVSYQLIQNHGGEITVERNHGAGLTFQIRIPNRPERTRVSEWSFPAASSL